MELELQKYLKLTIEHYRLGKKRKWEARLVDTFSGDSITIDNDILSAKPLPISDYAKLEEVQTIAEEFGKGKALYLFSAQ